MKAGEALVGMKRRGSQLQSCHVSWLRAQTIDFFVENLRGGWLAHLRKQNMLVARDNCGITCHLCSFHRRMLEAGSIPDARESVGCLLMVMGGGGGDGDRGVLEKASVVDLNGAKGSRSQAYMDGCKTRVCRYKFSIVEGSSRGSAYFCMMVSMFGTFSLRWKKVRI